MSPSLYTSSKLHFRKNNDEYPIGVFTGMATALDEENKKIYAVFGACNKMPEDDPIMMQKMGRMMAMQNDPNHDPVVLRKLVAEMEAAGMVMGPTPFKEPYCYEYDLQKLKWKKHRFQGKILPKKVEGGGAVIHKGHFYLFGGEEPVTHIMENKLYALSLKTFEWKLVKTKGSSIPAGREGHGMFKYKSTIHVFGGTCHNYIFFNDYYTLSLETFKWKRVKLKGDAFTARSKFAYCVDQDMLYVHGGDSNARTMQITDSLNVFESINLKTMECRHIKLIGDPPLCTSEHRMVPYVLNGNRYLILFGGYIQQIGSNMSDPRNSFENVFPPGTNERTMASNRSPYRDSFYSYEIKTATWQMVDSQSQSHGRVGRLARGFGINFDGELFFGLGYGDISGVRSVFTKEHENFPSQALVHPQHCSYVLQINIKSDDAGNELFSVTKTPLCFDFVPIVNTTRAKPGGTAFQSVDFRKTSIRCIKYARLDDGQTFGLDFKPELLGETVPTFSIQIDTYNGPITPKISLLLDNVVLVTKEEEALTVPLRNAPESVCLLSKFLQECTKDEFFPHVMMTNLRYIYPQISTLPMLQYLLQPYMMMASLVDNGKRVAKQYLAALKSKNGVNNKQKSFTFYLRMLGMEPALEREFTVGGQLNLKQLHDHVLCPIIGFTRGYHSFAFQLPINRDNEFDRDNTPFIGVNEKTSNALDMMFIPVFYNGALINASKVLLGELELHVGSKIHYIYDLGDCWTFELTVKDLSDEERPIELHSGCMAGPPEDIGGVYAYVAKVNSLCGLSDDQVAALTNNRKHKLEPLWDHYDTNETVRIGPGHPQFAEMFKNEFMMKNIDSMDFDPAYFDLEYARKQLQTALYSAGSHLSISKFINTTFTSGLQYENDMKADFVENASIKSKCNTCDKTVGLKKCSRCARVLYCSSACQKQDWKAHKSICVARS